MAVTLEEQAQRELIRYVTERGLSFRPDDPITAALGGTMQKIGSMGSEIRRLERENAELKAEIKRLKS
jgi:hypothetical protein